MPSPTMISVILVVVVSALLIVTGLKKQPGIGVMGAIVIILVSRRLRGYGFTDFGFGAPDNWGLTILLGLVLGIAIQLLGVAVIEPLTERMTGEPHDHSIVENVKGNWKAFLLWVLAVWVLVAGVEEGIYRGFLMTEMARVIGTGVAASVVNVLVSSAVFGLSHGYQGRSGILSTGFIGILLGLIFVLSRYNLWLAIFTHGFIDTVGIGMIAADVDKHVRQVFTRSETGEEAS